MLYDLFCPINRAALENMHFIFGIEGITFFCRFLVSLWNGHLFEICNQIGPIAVATTINCHHG